MIVGTNGVITGKSLGNLQKSIVQTQCSKPSQNFKIFYYMHILIKVGGMLNS